MTPFLLALLVFVGLTAAAVAFDSRRHRQVRNLEELLEVSYLEQESADPAEVGALLARTGVLAERAMARAGLLSRIASVVERSDWQLKPGELGVVSLVAGALGAVIMIGLHAWILAPFALVLGLLVPFGLCHHSVTRRRKKFEAQFPDILDMLSASLESGSGIPQALELVVAEVDEPAAGEFARVLTATRLGTPWVEALTGLAERLDSRDLRWTVQAILVQQRTGGRLADVLRSTAETMRGREEVRRELAALTAEGKLSAYVLTGLPFAFAGFLILARGTYVHPLFTTRLGLVMVIGGLILLAGSYAVMRRIIRVEV